jgi:hypothetical protein
MERHAMTTDDSDAVSRDVVSDVGEPAVADAGFEPIQADSWHWQFSDEADVAVDLTAPLFESQAAAEDWLTTHVESLQEQGVAAVTLFDGEGAVYGPMSLAPADPA